MTDDRFHDDGEAHIYGMYMRGVLIVCPRCEACAHVQPSGWQDARVICESCGLFKEITGKARWSHGYEVRTGRERYSESKIWLQTLCCGNTLWALNGEHLAWLESYVGSELRTRNTNDGCRNSSFQSRIPKWISSKKNREQVMAGIQKLKAKLPDQRRSNV